ncbi:hypothetical protein P691DRAFT_789476 [Macrolepiota fuliginosa MF-IS2]|uniref:Uncharacterized protein n=1 Tax=Macrolepiota fuliginosa MF-IS2 TaxID=1400762 RepID=A0A9P5X0V4_9AGAR|nr:hypothetical protein P691DRAFT_789476 [Macrolepiota fuliginosa MF-IS2]
MFEVHIVTQPPRVLPVGYDGDSWWENVVWPWGVALERHPRRPKRAEEGDKDGVGVEDEEQLEDVEVLIGGINKHIMLFLLDNRVLRPFPMNDYHGTHVDDIGFGGGTRPVTSREMRNTREYGSGKVPQLRGLCDLAAQDVIRGSYRSKGAHWMGKTCGRHAGCNVLAVANMIAHEDNGMLRSHYKNGVLVIPGLYSAKHWADQSI